MARLILLWSQIVFVCIYVVYFHSTSALTDKYDNSLLQKYLRWEKDVQLRDMPAEDKSIQQREELGEECYSETRVAANTENMLYYPGFDQYDNNVHCEWTFIAPDGYVFEVDIHRLSIEASQSCSGDRVQLFDGDTEIPLSEPLCGLEPPLHTFTTRSSILVVRFQSDQGGADAGFVLGYTVVEGEPDEVDIEDIIAGSGQRKAGDVDASASSGNIVRNANRCGEEVIEFSDQEGILESPGFQRSRYPRNSFCQWRIGVLENQVITISFSNLDLENTGNCVADSVSVYDGADTMGRLLGKFCGDELPSDLTSSGHYVYVVFRSNHKRNTGGFALSWTARDSQGTDDADAEDGVVTIGCDDVSTILVGQTEGILVSPKQQNRTVYPSDAVCNWHIVVPADMNVLLRFESFELEEPFSGTTCYDAVTLYDGANDQSPVIGSYCGTEIPSDILASTNHLFIVFQSDSSENAAGFRAHYSAKHGTGAVDGSDCGVPDVSPLVFNRIVGGVEAVPHSWPWLVSLTYRPRAWRHQCGGSVISHRWIMTAAHCVQRRDEASDFRVVLGEHNRAAEEGTEKIIDVVEIISHERYNRSITDNDIALFRLAEDVQYTRSIKPICLPRDDVTDSMMCITAGWGHTLSTGNSTVLNQIHVPIISQSQCSERGWYSGRLTENMICAGYPEGRRDSCQGDSGGPLMCRTDGRWRLYGLTSWGEECAAARKPGVYTRVNRYLEWIEDKTEVTPY